MLCDTNEPSPSSETVVGGTGAGTTARTEVTDLGRSQWAYNHIEERPPGPLPAPPTAQRNNALGGHMPVGGPSARRLQPFAQATQHLSVAARGGVSWRSRNRP